MLLFQRSSPQHDPMEGRILAVKLLIGMLMAHMLQSLMADQTRLKSMVEQVLEAPAVLEVVWVGLPWGPRLVHTGPDGCLLLGGSTSGTPVTYLHTPAVALLLSGLCTAPYQR